MFPLTLPDSITANKSPREIQKLPSELRKVATPDQGHQAQLGDSFVPTCWPPYKTLECHLRAFPRPDHGPYVIRVITFKE